MAGMKIITGFFSLIGNLSCFGLRALAALFVPPYEWQYFVLQIEAIGWQSLPLITAAGLAPWGRDDVAYQERPGDLWRRSVGAGTAIAIVLQ